MKRLDRLDTLKEYMSADEILEELVRALGEKQSDEYLDYIICNHGLICEGI